MALSFGKHRPGYRKSRESRATKAATFLRGKQRNDSTIDIEIE